MTFKHCAIAAALLLATAQGFAASLAVVSCYPEKTQAQQNSGFDRILPNLMEMVTSGAKRGEVADSFFMDENYRNGAVILLKGDTPVSARKAAESYRDRTQKILDDAKLPFVARCTVGGRMQIG